MTKTSGKNSGGGGGDSYLQNHKNKHERDLFSIEMLFPSLISGKNNNKTNQQTNKHKNSYPLVVINVGIKVNKLQ